MATTLSNEAAEQSLPYESLLIMRNYGQQIELSKAHISIPGFERNRVYTATDKSPEVPFPGYENCAHAATYYALNYLDAHVSMGDVKAAYLNKTIDHMALAVETVERMQLLDLLPEDFESESITAPGYLFVRKNRPEHSYNQQIETLAEEILKGGVIIFDIEAVNEFRDVDFDPEGEEERHALAIFGFEIDERGVPVFHAYDSNVAQSKPVRIDARRLLEYGSFDYAVIRRKQKEQQA
jgi:hypothetical protein